MRRGFAPYGRGSRPAAKEKGFKCRSEGCYSENIARTVIERGNIRIVCLECGAAYTVQEGTDQFGAPYRITRTEKGGDGDGQGRI